MLQSTALKILQTGANVFLTGEPGSGKTHTINAYVAWLRERGIEPAITASTGIAATHIGGTTIHSWSGLGVRDTLTPYDLDAIASNKRVIEHARSTNVLIIDEVSMLSRDVLSMVDVILREVRQRDFPFGGMQVVLVGDFFQLPPVVRGTRVAETVDTDDVAYDMPQAPFAFTSIAWEALNPIVCYLHEQHRQSDDLFSKVLGALRKGEIEEEIHEVLSARATEVGEVPPDTPRLYSHNANVDNLNDARLVKLKGTAHTFAMFARGAPHLVENLKRGCLSPETLVLKEGAKVMFTKNDPTGAYVNGTLGVVESFTSGGAPVVRTSAGRRIEVEATEWKIDDGGKTLARISQLPLRLAWAITVHKSQGMTLDAAAIDLSQAFEYGQGYVALSRVRSLEGLHLVGYNQRALEVHPQVHAQDIAFKKNSAAARKRFETMSDEEHAALSDTFVRASGGNPAGGVVRVEKKKKVSHKGATFEKTLELLKEGKGIGQVAQERKLAATTIANHIEELFMQGKLDKRDVERVAPRHVLEHLATIVQAFDAHGSEKLAPVHAALKGKFSFDELRLARLLI
jgi:ATP-dependent exoDNAse (exonuclease V) alpha subunit